jgi:transposase
MDLRRRVLLDVDAGLGTQATAEKYRVSTRWIQQLKRRRAETGEVAARSRRRLSPPRMAVHDAKLAELVRQKPDATLRELQQELGVSIGTTSIWRALKRLGLTLKKSSARRGAGSARRRRAAHGLAVLAGASGSPPTRIH